MNKKKKVAVGTIIAMIALVCVGCLPSTRSKISSVIQDVKQAICDHDPEKRGEKPADCEHDGYTGDSVCKKCGKLLSSGKFVPATGHQYYISGDSVPSCEEDGYTGDILCSRCNKVAKVGTIIEAYGHRCASPVETPPSCMTDGYTGDTVCMECGKVIKTGELIPALNHPETETRGYVPASKKGNGYSGDIYCLVCGELLKKGETLPQIISNDDDKGGYDWQYTENAIYPLKYTDSGMTITIDKVWYKAAWCYVAQIKMSDYHKFYTYCGNNTYGGLSGTTKAASDNNAILATNGCYSAPQLNYPVVRNGIVWNRGDATCSTPAFYNANNGLFGAETTLGINGKTYNEAVSKGLLTDTFCFGPQFVFGKAGSSGDSRAQRTFIGTDGTAGSLVLVVSEGRYVDGVSAGLTHTECSEVLAHYGCNFGIPLDGGGSSTMVFKGTVLNHLPSDGERKWIVDFLIFK